MEQRNEPINHQPSTINPEVAEKESILLIEDAEDYRLLLRHMLEPFFTIYDAPTLARGLEMLKERPYFCVLLDLSLPDSNSRATFPAVANSISAASVIIVSGTDDSKFIADMILGGAAGYVVKGKDDVDGPQLYRVIRDAVRLDRLLARVEDGTTRIIRKTQQL